MSPLLILQVIVSISLVVIITLQSNSSSLGSSLTSATQSGYHTKNGPEKLMFIVTIALAVVFVLISAINLILNK